MTCKKPLIDDLFLAAADFPSAERAAQLENICGDDADLRERLEQLLRAHSRVDSLLESPAPELDVGWWQSCDQAGTEIGTVEKTKLNGNVPCSRTSRTLI